MGIYKFVLIVALLSSSTVNIQENIVDRNNLAIIEEIEVIDIHCGIIQEEIIEDMGEDVPINSIRFNTNGLLLKEGVSSEQVLNVKKFLIAKGYVDIKEDYYFDSRMKEIIIDYQKRKGLSPDGIVGMNTYEKINEDMQLYNIYISERQVEFIKDVPTENWIIINKSNNTLYHLNEKDIVARYSVATGKTPSHTPEGKFSIVTKSVNPSWGGAGRYTPIKGGAPNNPLGKRWMGLSISGGGVYGIHGNADYGSIGRYVSLGCVRMYNEDVEYLYDIIGKGTPVWIGNEANLNQYGIIFQ